MQKRKKKTTKSNRFTPRQLALLNDLSNGRSIGQARSAGVDEDGDAGKPVPLLAKHTPETTSQLLDKCGLSREALIEEYLKPLLKARSRKSFSSQGQVGKQLIAADEATLRALDIALRLHGAYPAKPKPPESIKDDGFVTHIVLNVPFFGRPAPSEAETNEALAAIAAGREPVVKRADAPMYSEYPDLTHPDPR